MLLRNHCMSSTVCVAIVRVFVAEPALFTSFSRTKARMARLPWVMHCDIMVGEGAS